MKKIIAIVGLFTLFLGSYAPAFALSNEEAVEEAVAKYTEELKKIGLTAEGAANAKAATDVKSLIDFMNASQSDADHSFDAIKKRVDSLLRSDLRRDDARDELDKIKNDDEDGLLDLFMKIDPEQEIFLQESIAGAPPRVLPSDDFTLAQESVENALRDINRILISPTRPGAVPEGDIVSDFIPQIIRQLFRFAWLAVLVAFTVSGVMLIIAHGNDEKITKAKQMIYFSFVGFAFIALAFALVKAVTDIDFFRFI